jgi:CSLREA domain-containing protein
MGYPGKLITFISLFTLGLAAPAQAAIFDVTQTNDPTPGTCDSNCSLREAVILANTMDGDDEIRLKAETYVLTRQGGDDTAQVGDLDLTDDGDSITITGVSADATIIDAAGMGDRIFDVVAPGNQEVHLNKLTLQNGNAGNGNGGAVAVSTSGGNNLLFLSDCNLLDNHATDGGAIWGQNSGGMELIRSVVSGNTASNNGGGIFTTNGFQPTIVESTIDGNGAGGDGGGWHLNTGGSGVFVGNSTFSDNEAAGLGGGLYFTAVSPIFFENSTFSGNRAAQGGGMRLGSLSMELRNVTITENISSGEGAGLYIEADIDPFVITNSILANNSNPFPNPDCFEAIPIPPGHLTSLGFNLFGSISECTLALGTGDQTGIADPQLGPLANNGGPTQTHGNLEGSPAIDAGDPSGCLDSNDVELTTDQRGEPRPVNGRCDIGAFEGALPPSPSPVPTDEPGGGGCAMGKAQGGLLTLFIVMTPLLWVKRRFSGEVVQK